MRKIVKVSGNRNSDWRKPNNCYSMWTFWIDIETSEEDLYYNLNHDQLFDLLSPFIKKAWPNIDIMCGACSGGGPIDSNTGVRGMDKDFYLYFKTEVDEAEFILENQRLVGIEI